MNVHEIRELTAIGAATDLYRRWEDMQTRIRRAAGLGKRRALIPLLPNEMRWFGQTLVGTGRDLADWAEGVGFRIHVANWAGYLEVSW